MTAGTGQFAVNAAAPAAGTAAGTMNPTPTASPPTALDAAAALGAALRAAAIEQVMRASDDDLALLPLLEVVPGTTAAAAALGRLMTEAPQRLVAGCPLIAFVTGQLPDPHWRDACPARPQSLHAHLDFLAELYGRPDAADPYTALEMLRRRSEADLADTT